MTKSAQRAPERTPVYEGEILCDDSNQRFLKNVMKECTKAYKLPTLQRRKQESLRDSTIRVSRKELSGSIRFALSASQPVQSLTPLRLFRTDLHTRNRTLRDDLGKHDMRGNVA